MSFSKPRDNVARLGLKESMVVADFGAGSGEYSVASGDKVGNSGKVYAIDIQQDLFPHIKELADRRGLKNIESIWGDIEEGGGTGLKDSFVDAVLISNILFQLEEKDSVAREAFRILKSNGKVLVVDWTDSFGGLGPTGDSVFTKESAEELFSRNGFIKEESFDAGDHHYGLIFKKG